MPLHKEPETDYIVRTPMYLSQQTAIMGISRDLPAGALLAVKEHVVGLGWRPPQYYRQIADLKNVVLLELFEPSIEIIKRAALTVTMLGTGRC